MKRMWSEEEVNAAIAEYAATHPSGGKLYLHNIKAAIDDEDMGNSTTIYFSFVSTSNTPCLAIANVPEMTVAVTSHQDASYVYSAMTIRKSGNDVYATAIKDGQNIQIGEFPYQFNSLLSDTVYEL